jgi:hypothetical protein
MGWVLDPFDFGPCSRHQPGHWRWRGRLDAQGFSNDSIKVWQAGEELGARATFGQCCDFLSQSPVHVGMLDGVPNDVGQGYRRRF